MESERHSKANMDEGEQDSNQLNPKMDYNLDERYKSELVAYDTETHKLQPQIPVVTANEVMFGDSKGHEVLPLNEAIGKIREDLDHSIKMGNLKTESTEGVLLDIRQALNQ